MCDIDQLEAVAGDFDRDADDDFVDPKRLAAVVDRLQGDLCKVVHRAKQRGDHLLAGRTACSWVAKTCGVSTNSASDRLRVGKQLESMPRLAEALSSGEIGYQATSVICHLQEQLSEVEARLDEEMWIVNARKYSIKNLP